MNIVPFLIRIVVLLISLSVHETAHGIAAYAMGDNTAKENGRLSLNPLDHIDIVGFIMMVIAGFGWAKPVPVDMMRFRHPKQGMAVTAVAGPLSNMILAFVAGVVLVWLQIGEITDNETVLMILQMFYTYNCMLAVFNLIPIPPLDGSRVIMAFLPNKYYYKIMQYERYGMLVLMVLIFTNVLDKPLDAGFNNMMQWIENLVLMLPFWR